MGGNLVYFGLPLAVYFGLCLLPRGRWAVIGLAVAALVLAAAWAAGFGVVPLDGGIALIKVLGGAIALAALLQFLRTQLGSTPPRWVYPVLVVLAMLEGGSPAFHALGI